jgi:hypothetical protein
MTYLKEEKRMQENVKKCLQNVEKCDVSASVIMYRSGVFLPNPVVHELIVLQP